MTREDAQKVQEQFLLTDQSMMIGTLQDDTDCKILLDSGATQICM